MKNLLIYIILLLSFIIYSLTGIFMKLASLYSFLSIGYISFFVCACFIMVIYAILWQQIIIRIPISNAYMFKGTSIIWTMLFCNQIFDEPISLMNILGMILIILGIALYSMSDIKK